MAQLRSNAFRARRSLAVVNPRPVESKISPLILWGCNIFAKQVVIAGEVIGNIEATSGLEICNTGRVYGDISGDRLIIDEGAIYKGKVNMDVISSKNIYEGKLELVNS